MGPSDDLVERVTWGFIMICIVATFLILNRFDMLCTLVCLWAQIEWTTIADLIQKRHNTSESVHFFGTLLLTLLWQSGINFYALYGPLFLKTLVLVWTSDISAYFFGGQRLNATKLFYTISPNKTLGGSIASLVTCGLLAYFLKQGIMHGAIISIFAQAGDLLESYVKRLAGLKDSNLGPLKIPGHGGILDRIDGLLLSVPFAFSVAIVSRMGQQ